LSSAPGGGRKGVTRRKNNFMLVSSVHGRREGGQEKDPLAYQASGLPPDLPGRIRSDMRLRPRVPHHLSAGAPAADDAPLLPEAGVPVAATDLELPAPAGLALTAGWNFAESLGLPLVAYVAGERLGGQGAGMAAATAMVWLTAAARKVLAGSIPGLLMISALVLTLQTALVLATGSVLLFLLQFPVANLALCILFARTAPTGRPLVARLAAEVVALRRPTDAHPGLDSFFRGVTWLWAGIFAASAIGLVILLVVEPVPAFLLFTTVVTVVGTAAGILLSVLWFSRMLRRCGLRVRFGRA
jgi:hypothetical protein